MTQELVSIITPVYQGQSLITGCVSSVLKQTYENWELLIISDDGWNYEVELAKKGIVDERIRHFSTHGVAQGVSFARNIGLDRASGKWITQLDVDDLYYPNRIKSLMQFAHETGLSLDNGLLVDGDSGRALFPLVECVEGTKFRLKDYKQTEVPLNFLFSRSLVNRPWDDIARCADTVFNLRLLERAGWANLDHQVLHECRSMPHSLSQTSDASTKYEMSYQFILSQLQNDNLGFESMYYRTEVYDYFWHRQIMHKQFQNSVEQGFQGSFQRYLEVLKGELLRHREKTAVPV